MVLSRRDSPARKEGIMIHKQFKKYHVGQRVYYTGPTSYNDKAEGEPGTIIVIGHNITVELDKHKAPYLDRKLCWNKPQKRLGIISVGDYVTKMKEITPI